MPPLCLNREETSAKQAITRPPPAAAKSQANGLAFPTRPEITDGSPKTPLPMMQFTISAVRLQRPMARRSVGWSVAVTAGLYHRIAGAGIAARYLPRTTRRAQLAVDISTAEGSNYRICLEPC